MTNLPLPHARLLNAQQAAAYCGVSTAYFKQHIHIQTVEIGNKRLFDVKDLDRFIDQQHPLKPENNWLGKLDESARERA